MTEVWWVLVNRCVDTRFSDPTPAAPHHRSLNAPIIMQRQTPIGRWLIGVAEPVMGAVLELHAGRRRTHQANTVALAFVDMVDMPP